ncbi:cytochrome c1 [Citrobacter koseri]|uniref:cytochrome c1 n=1 Tax=Citrobacter koseri TaxID=545 RepID=UPI001DF92109|nr:cytochrome c1 [Citrobacter koseri]CAG0248754.1 Cytochrome b/c1 [Citrobacter koseri]CAH6051194.1 Cytochrome b/c1 [Citrobacter koseri]
MKGLVRYSVLWLCILGASAVCAQETPPRQAWSFSGITGHYDKEQLRRGLQVYEEKCRACHGMVHLNFRTLTKPGGPELSLTEAKRLASGYVFPDIQDDGQPGEREGNLNDTFVSPYLNDQEARYLNNGALPVDLTYIVRARTYDRGFPQFLFDAFLPYTDQGADYVYALLTGYLPDDPEMKANRYAPGGIINMPKPLSDGEINWSEKDDIPETEEQYARDVTAFLAWAADPALEQRKHQGHYVMSYLVIMLALLLILRRLKRRSSEKTSESG